LTALVGMGVYVEAMSKDSIAIPVFGAVKYAGLGFPHGIVWASYFTAAGDGEQSHLNFWSLYLALSCWTSVFACAFVPKLQRKPTVEV